MSNVLLGDSPCHTNMVLINPDNLTLQITPLVTMKNMVIHGEKQMKPYT
jgi:hypothetical protein